MMVVKTTENNNKGHRPKKREVTHMYLAVNEQLS